MKRRNKKRKGKKDMADTDRGRWMKKWRGVESKVNKLLVSLDSSVETQRRVGEGNEEGEEQRGVGGGGGRSVAWGFNSSPLRPVGLPGYQSVWSWWWDAGVQS